MTETKSETGLDQLLNFALITLPFCFPFSLKLSAAFIIACAVFWIARYYKQIPGAFKNKDVLILLSIAVIPLLSLVYSSEYASIHFEKRISFFVFPLIFATAKISKETFTKILYSFIAGCTMAAFIVLVRQFSEITAGGYSPEVVLEAIGTSHVYLGMFLTFSVIASAYLALQQPLRSTETIVLICVAVFQLIFLFLIAAKMAAITLFLLSLISSVVYVIRTKRKMMGLLLMTIPIAVFVILFLNFGAISQRFAALFDSKNYFIDDNAWNSIGVRITVMKCTWDTWVTVPFFGTGLGDQQAALNACYSSLGFISMVDYNTHNQYLQFLLSGGIVGLATFLFVLGYSARQALKRKNVLYLCFLFVFMMCCLTESILERQQGIMFLAFFNAMFFFKNDE